MNEVLEGLNAWGCDLEGALERFLGDEKLYQSCLPMVVEDESFDGLKEALAADERKKAFDCAHTLKGVFANMGITPMFETVVKIVAHQLTAFSMVSLVKVMMLSAFL